LILIKFYHIIKQPFKKLSYSHLIYFIKCVESGEEVYSTNIWCGVQFMLRIHELD